MRLLAITPINIDADELQRRQARYRDLAPRGILVDVENIGTGDSVPTALETTHDIRRSYDELWARYLSADLTHDNGILADCVLDPLRDDRHDLGLPIYGITRLAGQFIVGRGDSI